MKKLLVSLLALFMFINTTPIFAQNTSNYNPVDISESFKESVYNSQYYIKYQDRIESQVVDKVVETEEGIRYTLSFQLVSEPDEYNNLVFVGDENGKIMMAALITQSSELITILSLIDEFTTNISSRKPIELCDNYVCTKKGIKYVNNGACNAIVGSACNVLDITGNPIWKYICKGGVVIACGLQTNACLEYSYSSDVCTL